MRSALACRVQGCLPRKRSAAELLDEHLTAVLDSFDVCALARVMFAPVLFLFHWRANTKNEPAHDSNQIPFVPTTVTSFIRVSAATVLTCGFAVGLLAVWTVINVNVWSIVFININTAEMREETLFNGVQTAFCT